MIVLAGGKVSSSALISFLNFVDGAIKPHRWFDVAHDEICW